MDYLKTPCLVVKLFSVEFDGLEMTGKESAVADWYSLGTCLEGLRKTMKKTQSR
jgi:hypothetical protein